MGTKVQGHIPIIEATVMENIMNEIGNTKSVDDSLTKELSDPSEIQEYLKRAHFTHSGTKFMIVINQ
jgi:hypothetical protein